jgi:RNA polymerase sigma-B factor
MSEKTGRPKPASDKRDSDKERAEERALFARYKEDPSPANEELLLEKFQSLVYKIVHKFSRSPDLFEDLVQEGTKGLLLAIRRFDIELNYRFSTYAWQTIQGEIQRYFRDRTWAVNVPRDLKEKSLRVFKAREELIANQSHEPTVAEVSAVTELSEEEVLEAMELGSAYHPQSFMDNTRESDLGIVISEESPGSDNLDMRITKRGVFWSHLLVHLSDNEARIVRLYFFEQRTQKEIAEILETSQMNVSRIMRNAIGKLRRLVIPADFDNMGML